jgi:hypothetical protein
MTTRKSLIGIAAATLLAMSPAIAETSKEEIANVIARIAVYKTNCGSVSPEVERTAQTLSGLGIVKNDDVDLAVRNANADLVREGATAWCGTFKSILD